MKNKEQKNRKDKEKQRESNLVTKESFSATFALFSLIAFLILCTRSLIFGEMGIGVHTLLTGIAGYMAYPLVLGCLYISVMSLIEKRLVKNYKAAVCFALMLVFAGLITHTACTYNWDSEGYLGKCLRAGENFPATPPMGILGGFLVYAVSSLLSKIGALVLFSALFLFCGYLFVVLLRSSKDKKSKRESTTNVNIPLTQTAGQAEANKESQANYQQTPMQTDMPYGYPSIQNAQTQRPAQSSGGSSPFATSTQNLAGVNTWFNQPKQRQETVKDPILSDLHNGNLIFDQTARVNNRPMEDTPPASPSWNSQYVPSYTEEYQKGFETEPISEKAPENSSPFVPPLEETEPVDPFASATPAPAFDFLQQKQEEPYIPPMVSKVEEPSSGYLNVRPETMPSRNEEDFEQNRGFTSSRTDSFAQSPLDASLETSPEQPQEEKPYRRHENIYLFSAENPRVFGDANLSDIISPENSEDSAFERTGGRDFSPSDRGGRGFNSPFEQETTPKSDLYKLSEEDGRRAGANVFEEEPEDNQYMINTQQPYEEQTPDLPENIEDFGRRSRGEEMDASKDFVEDRGRRVEKEEILNVEQPKLEEPVVKPQPAPKPPEPKKPRIPKPYVRISLDDLDCRDVEIVSDAEQVEEIKASIIRTLEEFKIMGASIASVTFGPTVTRYNVTLPLGIHLSKVVSLDSTLSMRLKVKGVSVYPNYEDGVVSVEVPRDADRQFVQLGSMLAGSSFVNAKASSLMFAMGKDVANRKVYGDISKMIHMLVAGSSGSGKSVFLGSLIISMIYKYSPEELRFILIDPKKTEFVLYNDLPHLMINEIITDVNKAVQSLNWAIDEMNRRYGLFEQMSRSGKYVVNLDQYNEQMTKHERLPKIVIIIDELADLMLAAKKEMEEKIQNLTQKARAAGIHLIVATQRPSADVITGVIKSNLSTRIAFSVTSDVDSRVILDQSGAQKLLGKGDFLYTMQGINIPVRVQSAFISPEESQKVVNFIKEHNEAYYDEEATAYINNMKGDNKDSSGGGGSDNVEQVYITALKYVILTGSASISMIQRKCSAGYNKAGKIVEWMEEKGYISPFDGAKARKVLITKEQFEEKYGPLD